MPSISITSSFIGGNISWSHQRPNGRDQSLKPGLESIDPLKLTTLARSDHGPSEFELITRPGVAVAATDRPVDRSTESGE